jgi:hypothetical protein
LVVIRSCRWCECVGRFVVFMDLPSLGVKCASVSGIGGGFGVTGDWKVLFMLVLGMVAVVVVWSVNDEELD